MIASLEEQLSNANQDISNKNTIIDVKKSNIVKLENDIAT